MPTQSSNFVEIIFQYNLYSFDIMPSTSGVSQIIGLACYAFLLYSPSSTTASPPADWNFPLPAVDQAVLAKFPHENEEHRNESCSVEQIKGNPPGNCMDDHHCSTSQKCCDGVCIPETHDCCSASEHCLPGDYCFFYGGQVRCCPEGMNCIHINGEVVFEHTFYWYEKIYATDEVSEEDWCLSVMDVTSAITVAASYAEEASAAFSSLSRGVLNSARIMSNSDIPTHTITQTTIMTP